MANKTKTVKEVADTPRVFASRISSKTFTLDGVTYTIKSLPNAVVNYIAGATSDGRGNINIGEMQAYTVAFGVTKFTGLKERDGKQSKCEREDIEIMGRRYEWLTQDSFDVLPRAHIPDLYQRIEMLAILSEAELEKLDFTKPLSEWEVQESAEA